MNRFVRDNRCARGWRLVTAPPLSASEVNWVLRRRDKVAAHIEALIAERGEGAVLFDNSR